MRRKLVAIFIFSLIASVGIAQKTNTDFTKEIKELNQYGKKIISSNNDSEKQALNEQYKSLLFQVISNKAAFEYNFDSLTTISILKQNQLKIYNWALPKTDGTFEYYAYVTTLMNNQTYKITELIDKSGEITLPENKILTANTWYGALYYQLIHDKKLGENYYTLLGWDGNNNLTNKKIIDVIQLDARGNLKLGASIFKMEQKTKKRIIFEYAENAVMSLKYHPKIEKIVYDYLIPTGSNLQGVYEYYGPALNRFDALLISKRKWIYEPDTKIELDRSVKDHMWNDPKTK
ncbi:MAG: hypothetical protein J5I47_13485 [Vicingus serpentipes]|nr:hypothetical protein [Vicingus serpentipes]